MICRSLTVLAAMAAFTTSAPAALLLESFESFTPGDAIAGLPLASAVSGPGATDGTVAAQSTAFGDSYQKIADVNLNATVPDGRIADGDLIETFTVDVLSELTDTGGFAQIVAGIFFGSDSSFAQIDGVKTGSSDSFLGTGTVVTTVTYDQDGSNFDFGSGTSSPVQPIFDKINTDLANGDFVGLGIYMSNGGAAGTVTVDNIRAVVVPEPTALGLLLCLGAAGATSQRKP